MGLILPPHKADTTYPITLSRLWQEVVTRREVEGKKVSPADPDVGVGEGPGGVADLVQDLAGVGAPEHGQLVHGPVPAGIDLSVLNSAMHRHSVLV